jgi:outer membrane lipoprotein SlyB
MPNIPLYPTPVKKSESDPVQVEIIRQKAIKEENEAYRQNIVNALQEMGVDGASNVMTQKEWENRRGSNRGKGTYRDYLEKIVATQIRRESLNKYKSTASEKIVSIGQEKSDVLEDAGKLRREKAAAKRSTGLIKTEDANKWKTKDTRTGKEKREGVSVAKSEGQKELDALNYDIKKLDEKKKAAEETIDKIDKYSKTAYNDTSFGGQAKANYTLGRLNQDTAQAYNDYIVSPTEENRMRADALGELTELFQLKNENALTSDDEDVNKAESVVRDWIGVSLANYIPQFIDQTKASIKGAAIGATSGAALGSIIPGIGTGVGAVKGAKAGWVAGASQQMFETTRGMVFKSLIDAGYDEETAIKAANDEAFVSSIIENSESCVELFSITISSIFVLTQLKFPLTPNIFNLFNVVLCSLSLPLILIFSPVKKSLLPIFITSSAFTPDILTSCKFGNTLKLP